MDIDWNMVFGILLLLGFIGALLAVAYFQWRGRVAAWTELAAMTGLTCEPGNFFSTPRVNGVYHGHMLTLDTFVRSHGKSSTTYTRIVVAVNNPTNLSFQLVDENIFQKVGKLLGAQDIHLGDDTFDSRFIIKGQPEIAVQQVLMSVALRQKLMQTRSMNLRVSGGELYYEKIGAETDSKSLVDLFDLLSDIADRIERGSGLPGWDRSK